MTIMMMTVVWTVVVVTALLLVIITDIPARTHDTKAFSILCEVQR